MTATVHKRLSLAEQIQVLGAAPVETFEAHLDVHDLMPLRTQQTDILQINVGKLCNQTCSHCHVDAGPSKTEENMDWATFEACIDVAKKTKPHTVDLTGGAPELNPH